MYKVTNYFSALARSRFTSLLLLGMLVLIGSTGCSRARLNQAEALAKEGSTTAGHVADYYQKLADARHDMIELTTVQLAYADTKPDKVTVQNLLDNQKALQTRVDWMHRLQGLYDALLKLTQYDASKEVRSAANDLVSATKEVTQHPIRITVGDHLVSSDPGGILGEALTQFARVQQMKEFNKNAPAVLNYLRAVDKVFNEEAKLYPYIIQERDKLRFEIGNQLIREGNATALEALQKQLDGTNTKLLSSAVSDPHLKQYQVNRQDVEMVSGLEDAMNIAKATAKELDKLVSDHEAYLDPKPKAAPTNANSGASAANPVRFGQHKQNGA